MHARTTQEPLTAARAIEEQTSQPSKVTRLRHGRLVRDEIGQTTAEYALVLLAAGTIAMLVISWARGDNSIDELFDLVLTKITTSIE